MKDNTVERMTDKITIVMSPSMKEEFYETCERQSINPSHLIRKWITGFIDKE